jgi:DNA-binding NtrC family response regulator
LFSQFVAQLSARHGTRPPRFDRRTKASLLQYDWPGNVRELRNVAETLCLLRDGKQVRLADLPESVRMQGRTQLEASPKGNSSLTLELDAGLESMIQQIVEAALELEHGNKQQAAVRLRISPRTVQRYVAAGRVKVPH